MELEKLKDKQKITNEEYMLMKDYKVVEDMLSDKIMGNSDNIDEMTTFEVIQDIKNDMSKEYEIRIQEEKEKNLKNLEEKRFNKSKIYIYNNCKIYRVYSISNTIIS